MGRDRVPTCAYMPVHQNSMIYLYGSKFSCSSPAPFSLPPPPSPALSAFARGTPIRSSRSRTVHNRTLERPRSLNAPVQHRREPTHRLRARRIVEQAHCISISFLYYPSSIPPLPPRIPASNREKILTSTPRILRDGLVRQNRWNVVVAIERCAQVWRAKDGIREDERLRRAAAVAVEVADGVELAAALAGGDGRGGHGGGAGDEGDEGGDGETHDGIGDGEVSWVGRDLSRCFRKEMGRYAPPFYTLHSLHLV